MKIRLQSFKGLSTRTLRFRLVLYLLIGGAIPLALALYMFYQVSSNHAQAEYRKSVMNVHRLVAERLENHMAMLREAAKKVNMDTLVQDAMGEDRQQTRGIIPKLDDGRIRRALAGHPAQNDIQHVCVSFYSSDVSMCTDTSFLLNEPLYNVGDERLDVVILQSGVATTLRYAAPLYLLDSLEVKGYIVFLLNTQSILIPPDKSLPLLRHTLVNDKGMALIGAGNESEQITSFNPESGGPFIQTSGNEVISGYPVVLLANRWMSVIRWKNAGLGDLRHQLGVAASLFLLLFAMLAIVISLLFSRSVTGPIQALRSLMKRAELGDLRAYWSQSAPQDIDELGESYNQMLNRLEDLIKQVKIEESLKKEKEFEALQYQLNPHFLYNTLNTIKWVAKIHRTPQISEAVSALVRLLQASLGKRGDFLTLQEEIRLARDYMDIQTFRYGDEIELVTDIEPVAGLCLVPKMILQPLVENAIIHGFDYSSDKKKTITIKGWIDRDLLLCQVEDNGKGMDPNLADADVGKTGGVKEKMSGIGIRHIREKIKLYYGSDYKMYIFSKPNQGTTIRMSLPIHRGEEH